jgi:hypothetical protein
MVQLASVLPQNSATNPRAPHTGCTAVSVVFAQIRLPFGDLLQFEQLMIFEKAC